MSDRLTEVLRSGWTGTDGAGPDLLEGLDARLTTALAARTRRRRTAAVAVVALAAALLLTAGDGGPELDAPRFAGDAPAPDVLRGRPELPTLPRLPATTGRLSTAQAPSTLRSMPTLPRRPTGPVRARSTPRPAGDPGTEARS